MASNKLPKIVEETLSLINFCRWDLARLRGVSAVDQDFNGRSREYLEAFRAPDDDALAPAEGHYRTIIHRPDVLEACLERAEESRAQADLITDNEVRGLLLRLADTYEHFAKDLSQELREVALPLH